MTPRVRQLHRQNLDHASAASAPNQVPMLDRLVELWNQSLAPDYALNPAHLDYRFRGLDRPFDTYTLAAAVVEVPAAVHPIGNLSDASPPLAGAILVSAWRASATIHVHVDGLVVHPQQRRQGVARALTAWAAEWARSQGATTLQLGSDPLRLLPGVPADSATPPEIWPRLDFLPTTESHIDWIADLSGYVPPACVIEVPALARPLAQREDSYLRAFLQQTAPNPSIGGLIHFLNHAPRLADLMVLWTETGIQGAIHSIVEDSPGGIAPWFPYARPKPWAALRAIIPDTTAAPLRWALLDATLRRLHNTGVNTCVLDAPQIFTAPDPIADFGFQPYHSFQRYRMPLTAD